MPSTFLTYKEQERLACFPDDIQPWDLITYFTLTEHDCSLMDTYQGESNRFGRHSSFVPCATSDSVLPISIPRQVT